MLISDSQLQLRLSIETTRNQVLQSLRPGQTLQAVILSSNNEGVVQLRIGTTELLAQTRVMLEAGQKVTLSVIKGGETPELQIMQRPTPKQVLHQAIKSTLPRQLPLNHYFDQLSALLKAGDTQQLPHPIKETVTSLNRSILIASETGKPAFPQQLKQAIQDSGTFLEARLAAGEPPAQDLKATLLRLFTQLKPEILQTLPTPPKSSHIESQTGPKTTATTASTSHVDPSVKLSPAKVESQSHSQQAQQLKTGLNNIDARLLLQITGVEPQQLTQQTTRADPPAASTLLHQLIGLFKTTDPGLLRQHPDIEPPQPPQPTAKAETTVANALLRQLIDLFKSTDGALSRIQQQQLTALQGEESGKTVWQLELPIRHQERTDSIEIRIEQQRSGADKAAHGWTIMLHFDLPALGPMHAQLTLREERLSTIFWAENGPTLQMLHEHIDTLRNSMQQAGLTIDRLVAYQGKPPESSKPAWNQSLLDEKA